MASLNRPKALLVISAESRIYRLNQLISVSIARRLFSSFQQGQEKKEAQTKEKMSQSPEGSSRHFSTFGRFVMRSNWQCLNRPKALLVISAGCSTAAKKFPTKSLNRPKALLVISASIRSAVCPTRWKVSIARRLFSSFQLAYLKQEWKTGDLSQSPEGSSRHFSIVFSVGGEEFEMSQSPEGSSRHFSLTYPADGSELEQWVSQSPEGSSRHFSWKERARNTRSPGCLNRPKALLVISAS